MIILHYLNNFLLLHLLQEVMLGSSHTIYSKKNKISFFFKESKPEKENFYLFIYFCYLNCLSFLSVYQGKTYPPLLNNGCKARGFPWPTQVLYLTIDTVITLYVMDK